MQNDIRKMTEEEKVEPLAPRKAWGDIPFQPRLLSLEVTASAMEGIVRYISLTSYRQDPFINLLFMRLAAREQKCMKSRSVKHIF